MNLRACVPILGMVALAALFLKLPEVPNLFTLFECKTCFGKDPFTPLIGSAYFGLLIAISLLFPGFPNRYVSLGGLIWALLLAPVMTYLNLPVWCAACLVGHACNIFIWGIWFFVPSKEQAPQNLGARLCLMLFVPISIVALFSSLNLTFMAYGSKSKKMVAQMSTGDPIPLFTAQTVEGRAVSNTESGGMVLNFVAPDCPFCKEQLQVLDSVAKQSSYRFVNISPALQPELIQNSPTTEWVEDKDQKLRKLFKIYGYPTLYVVGSDGKISRVIRGVPDGLKEGLQASLTQ